MHRDVCVSVLMLWLWRRMNVVTLEGEREDSLLASALAST